MGASQNPLERPACHFFNEANKGETPVFRSIDYPLDAPLPEKYEGIVSTLLEGFE